MKTLFIMRHAKSSWNDPALADFDRPLNERGMAAGMFMGELMASIVLLPDLIVSSPAKRAMRTALMVKESSGSNSPIQFDERIYEASPQTLRTVVSQIQDKFASMLLVGHNPGMEGLVHDLTGRLEPMPTAALAVIGIDIKSWMEVSKGIGVLNAVYRPKDEMKQPS